MNTKSYEPVRRGASQGVPKRIAMKATHLLLMLAGLAAFTASAQSLPPRMRLIVPVAAAGPTDMSARVLAEKMSAQLGIPVIVENRPGTGGAIAATVVKQAAPNGETLLHANSAMMTLVPHLNKSLSYAPFEDFDLVSGTTYVDAVFVVNGQLPINNLKEFFAYAASAKPSLSIGSSGTGSLLHGYLELLKDAGSIPLLHVPYKGAAPAFADVLGGQVAGVFVTFGIAMSHMRTGKVKALAVVGSKRSQLAPEVPTFEELGYPGFPVSWSGILAPKRTSPEVIKLLIASVTRALEQADVQEKFKAAGMSTWPVSGAEFDRAMRTESDRWKKVVIEKNISVE